MNRDLTTILDIVRAGELIADFVRGMDQRVFLTDKRTQSAVLHQLLIIGEAVKRLTRDFRAEHSQIPWAKMAGMRDVLIHAYDIVDLGEVWQTATVDIPYVLSQLVPMLPKQPDSNDA
jgi:uncharacterized protein with HEPN domain